MQCMLGLARNCTAMHRLPLFSLLCLSENFQSLRTTSQGTGGYHRLRRNTTGTKLIHRPSIDCRSALNAAGRHWMSAEPATHSSRGQKLAWQCNSNNVCTNHAPYHICDSKGHVPRFSDHQSRISMHDGPKNQMCNFYFKCMQTKQTHKGAKPLSWLGQEVEHACLCDAILDMSTSMQSCQCKGAYKLTNIQGMKHQCQPSSMQGVMWVSKHAKQACDFIQSC